MDFQTTLSPIEEESFTPSHLTLPPAAATRSASKPAAKFPKRKILFLHAADAELSLRALNNTIAFSINAERNRSDVLIFAHVAKLKKHFGFGLKRTASFESLAARSGSSGDNEGDADPVEAALMAEKWPSDEGEAIAANGAGADEPPLVYRHDARRKRLELKDAKLLSAAEAELLRKPREALRLPREICTARRMRFVGVVAFTSAPKECALRLAERFEPAVVALCYRKTGAFTG